MKEHMLLAEKNWVKDKEKRQQVIASAFGGNAGNMAMSVVH